MTAESQRRIVHVDMDAFYAAIEQKENPELRGRPVVVGADPKGGRGRGVVSTCSYEARPYGIHSAMPVSRAYKLCPHAVFVPPRFAMYGQYSRRVFTILEEFSPAIEPISIDEAFLDCSGTDRLFGSDENLANTIKSRVLEETGLTASVGIAPVKFIAKIASDLNKPDGMAICAPGKERDFLAPLPVRFLRGAGPRAQARLNENGIRTFSDLAQLSRARLIALFGKNGQLYHDQAHGVDSRPVVVGRQRKTMSEERTFSVDTADTVLLAETLDRLADDLGHRLRLEGLRARTIVLKLRYADFQTLSRRRSLEAPTDSTARIRTIAAELLSCESPPKKEVRLIGLGLANLIHSEGSGQLTLSFVGEDLQSNIGDALFDRLKQDFGDRISRAGLLDRSRHRADSD